MQPYPNGLLCMLGWGRAGGLISRLGKEKGKYFPLLLRKCLNHQWVYTDLHQPFSWHASEETKDPTLSDFPAPIQLQCQDKGTPG